MIHHPMDPIQRPMTEREREIVHRERFRARVRLAISGAALLLIAGLLALLATPLAGLPPLALAILAAAWGWWEDRRHAHDLREGRAVVFRSVVEKKRIVGGRSAQRWLCLPREAPVLVVTVSPKLYDEAQVGDSIEVTLAVRSKLELNVEILG